MIRDILNWQGVKIGELELPDGTSEEVWQRKLAVYAIAPESVPLPPISPRQIRLALLGAGITLDMIETALGSLPEPEKSAALIEWEYASYFDRSNPLVASVASMLGWGDAELNNLWLTGAGL